MDFNKMIEEKGITCSFEMISGEEWDASWVAKWRCEFSLGKRKMFTSFTENASTQPCSADVLCMMFVNASRYELNYNDFCAKFCLTEQHRSRDLYSKCELCKTKLISLLGEELYNEMKNHVKDCLNLPPNTRKNKMKIKSSDGNKEIEVTKSEIKELIQKEGGNREKYLTPNVFLTSEDKKSIKLYYQSNNGSFKYICSVSWDGKKIFISS